LNGNFNKNYRLRLEVLYGGAKMEKQHYRKESSEESLSLEQGFCLPLHPASHPELQALYRLHLPVISAVEIRLRGADVRMAHQSLDGSKVIPVVEERRGKGMADRDEDFWREPELRSSATSQQEWAMVRFEG
jgi:hypothetical protein